MHYSMKMLISLFLLATSVDAQNVIEPEWNEPSFTLHEDKIQDDMLERLFAGDNRRTDETACSLEELKEIIRLHETQPMVEDWHDFGTNGSGYLKTQLFYGVWDIHGHSRWNMGRDVINITQYSMQKLEALNNTFLSVTYTSTNVTERKQSAELTTATYTKTMTPLGNGSLIILSISVSAGKGSIHFSSKGRGHFKVESLALTNDTTGKSVTTVHSTNRGVMKSRGQHISWRGKVNGTVTEGGMVRDEKNNHHIPIHSPRIISNAFALTGISGNFTTRYYKSVLRKRKCGSYRISVQNRVTADGFTQKSSVKGKGNFWPSDHSLPLGSQETTDDRLITTLQFLL